MARHARAGGSRVEEESVGLRGVQSDLEPPRGIYVLGTVSDPVAFTSRFTFAALSSASSLFLSTVSLKKSCSRASCHKHKENLKRIHEQYVVYVGPPP